MPYVSPLAHTQRLLGDFYGLWTPSAASLQAFVDRGSRDVGRLGLVIQQRRTFATAVGVTVYTLPVDHVRTFTCFRGLFGVSVRLASQDGHVWWMTADTNGNAAFTDAQPAGSVLLATPTTSWLTIASPDGTLFYVHPSNTGLLLVDDVVPGVGVGTAQTVQLRDPDGFAWYPRVSNVRLFSLSSTGSATLSGPAINDHSMQRVEPEAIMRIDPRLSTGQPERYAVLGNRFLRLHPTPDAIYEVRHLYFSDDLLALPAAAECYPPLLAAGEALRQRGRHQAATLLMEMAGQELALLGENLSPLSLDGLDLFTMPPRG